MTEPRAIDECIERLQEMDEMNVAVTETALLCWHHFDQSERLRALWGLCAFAYASGRADEVEDIYQMAKANPGTE